MGDPLTISAGVGIGAGLLGSALRGSAEQQALAAKQRADLQNQQLAEGQAADALARGAQQAGRIQMRGAQVLGSERAGYGASGVDSNVGSAAQVQGATAAMSSLDAQTAENNAARQAWGYRVSAQQYGEQAALDKQGEGESEAGTILGGLGQGAAGFGRLFGAGKGGGY